MKSWNEILRKATMGKNEKTTAPDADLETQKDDISDAAAENTANNDTSSAENNEIAELKAQILDQKDKYLRLLAEFENHKKRVAKEKLDWIQNASRDTMSALLPVLDDFDRALKSADAQGETFPEGVVLIYNKLYNILHSRGLKPMESNGISFDPEWHEAITEIPASDESMKGKVIDTVETGYLLNDKIIRYAKVVVGK
jgi:molecular chaperone GrpE